PPALARLRQEWPARPRTPALPPPGTRRTDHRRLPRPDRSSPRRPRLRRRRPDRRGAVAETPTEPSFPPAPPPPRSSSGAAMIHSVRRRLSHHPRPTRRIALSMIAAGLVGIGLSLALFAAPIVYGLSGSWISLLLGTSGIAPFIAISLWFVPRTAAL